MKAELPFHIHRFAGDSARQALPTLLPALAIPHVRPEHVPGIRLRWWWAVKEPNLSGNRSSEGVSLYSHWAHLYGELEGRRKSSLPQGASPTHLVLQGGTPGVAKPSLACPAASLGQGLPGAPRWARTWACLPSQLGSCRLLMNGCLGTKLGIPMDNSTICTRANVLRLPQTEALAVVTSPQSHCSQESPMCFFIRHRV